MDFISNARGHNIESLTLICTCSWRALFFFTVVSVSVANEEVTCHGIVLTVYVVKLVESWGAIAINSFLGLKFGEPLPPIHFT